MKLSNNQYVIDELIRLRSSTTLFLESLSRESLNVDVFNDNILENSFYLRESKLFFYSSDSPLIFSVSKISLNAISPIDLEVLRQGAIPIGRLFYNINKNEIKKCDITVCAIKSKKIAYMLDVQSEIVFKKSYDFMENNTKIAEIIEYFSEESMSRILS